MNNNTTNTLNPKVNENEPILENTENLESLESAEKKPESVEGVFDTFNFEPNQEIQRIEKRFDGFQDKLTEAEISTVSHNLNINQRLENVSNRMTLQKKSMLSLSQNEVPVNTPNQQDITIENNNTPQEISSTENTVDETTNTPEDSNLEGIPVQENLSNTSPKNSAQTETNTQESEQTDNEKLISNISKKTSYLDNQYNEAKELLESITKTESSLQDKLFEFLIESELQSKINSQLEINKSNLNPDNLVNLDIDQLNKINQNLDNIKNSSTELIQKVNTLNNPDENNFENITKDIQNSLGKFDLDSYNLKQEISSNSLDNIQDPEDSSNQDSLEQKLDIESNLMSNIKGIKDIYQELKSTIKSSVQKNPDLKNEFRQLYTKNDIQKNIMSSLDTVTLIENSLPNLSLAEIKELNQNIVDLKAKFNQFLVTNTELINNKTNSIDFNSKGDYIIQTSNEINQDCNILKAKLI